MPKFAPRIRVEVYVPIRYEAAYQETLSWVVREFTELRGGCTVIENTAGFYLSQDNETVEDRVNVVYSDFPMNWADETDYAEALEYCQQLRNFLLLNLWEEAILITARQTSHLAE